ncbi:MAG TPA: hypothetical protein VKE74_33765, partial [Gemmataceae bacterium]|nr:hypothetical protein [Gemmataceae bacterium]
VTPRGVRADSRVAAWLPLAAGERSPTPAEHPGLPTVTAEHPLRWRRDEMDLPFDRCFGCWPAAWEANRVTAA